MPNKKNGLVGLENIPLDISLNDCDIANYQLPDIDLLQLYDNTKNRTLWIDFDIDQNCLIRISKLIIAYNRYDADNNIEVEKRKPIKLLINSYGGELDITLHFIDLCLMSKTPIYTYNVGVAMSAGFYILLAGTKRFAFKNSQALCHQGNGGFEGDAETIKSHTAQYNKLLSKLSEYILARTKITKDVYNKKRTKEWFINGTEQIDLGIVDNIVESIEEIL